MSYYKESRKAAQYIDEEVSQVLNQGLELNISALVLRVTRSFEVGEKVVTKRINHWKSSITRLEEKDGVLSLGPEEA